MMDKMNNLLAVGQSANRLDELTTARREKSRAQSDKSDDFASELGAEMMQAGAMAQAASRPLPEAVNVSLSGKAVPEKQVEKVDEAGKELTKAVLVQNLGQNEARKESALKTGQDAMGNRIQGTEEKTRLSMNAAASTNTAATIAGLKPWSKDWVFDSQTLKDIQSSIQNAGSTPGAKTPVSAKEVEAQPSEAGAWINLDPRSRGEAEATPLNSMNSMGSLSSMDSLDFISRRDFQMQAGPEHSLAAAIQHPMNGMIMDAPRPSEPQPQARAMANSSLSGNEFVATLSALRGGAEGAAAASRPPFGQAGKQGEQGGDEQAGQGLTSSEGFRPEAGTKGRKAAGASFENGLDQLSGSRHGIAPGVLHGTAGNQLVAGSQLNPSATEVTGHVVKGAMAQDRLSTESLQGIAGGIRNFSAQGNGEMKVRLRPDHLGELTIRVNTQGNQVGLKIQASSEESKKILEESLSHLKESMAAQKLDLAQVDLTVAKLGGSFTNDSGMDHSNRNQSQQFQNAWADQGNAFGNPGNPSGQSRGNSGQGLYEAAAPRASVERSIPNPGLGRGNMNAGAQVSGRLDVRA